MRHVTQSKDFPLTEHIAVIVFRTEHIQDPYEDKRCMIQNSYVEYLVFDDVSDYGRWSEENKCNHRVIEAIPRTVIRNVAYRME